MGIVIYLDLILVMNLIFNFCLLMMTNYFAKSGKKLLRLLFGASIATIIIPFYVFMPDSFIQSFWMKALFSLLIILCTFGYTNVQRFMKQIGLFYMTTFITGGGLSGIQYMLQSPVSQKMKESFWYVSNINHEQLHIGLFILGFPLLLFFLKHVMDRQVKDKINYDQLYQVMVEMHGTKQWTMGYIDSGNQLSDPLTNRPVVICDTAFLQRFFTEEEWGSIEQSVLLDDISSFPGKLKNKVSIIPYHGVGGEAGYLYTIRPDSLKITYQGEILSTNQVLIGIQLGKLTANQSYHCLLQPELIQLKMTQSA